MFTGIVEEQGRAADIKSSEAGMEITLECSKILEDIKPGASIAVNGACQTVIEYGADYFKVQVSNETLGITNFKNLKKGGLVNLERALTLNKRIDGHFVSGHIDCTAEFIQMLEDGFSKRLYFKLPEKYAHYVIYKGSIAVNGVSLTIASIENNIFSCALIPATLKEVNLSALRRSDLVNIETDLFAKYIEKAVKSNGGEKISRSFLIENGFV